MAGYIEREELINQIRLMINRSSVGETSLNDISAKTICGLILEQPTADVAEVKHGEWELCGNDDTLGCSYFCSLCGWNIDEEDFVTKLSSHNFCPNCGAKMDLKGKLHLNGGVMLFNKPLTRKVIRDILCFWRWRR